MRRPTVALACIALSGSACLSAPAAYQANPQLMALSPVVVFQGSSGPLSYQSAVGRDGQRYVPAQRVHAEACQRGIQVPILSVLSWAAGGEPYRGSGSLSAGWGDGSYQAAIDRLRQQMPAGAVLYDVQADIHHQSYLTVYRVQCVEIDAGVLVPTPAPPSS